MNGLYHRLYKYTIQGERQYMTDEQEERLKVLGVFAQEKKSKK
jgi:hypothetical protein